MAHDLFDACITLNNHHLAAAGLSGGEAEAVVAVRQAVERMAGAGWIDVEALLPGHPAIFVLHRSTLASIGMSAGGLLARILPALGVNSNG